MGKLNKNLIATAILGCLLSVPAFAQSLTIQGRVTNSAGTPITGNAVQFRVQVKAPNAARCVLYDETQTLDLSSTNGLFSINLNNGHGAVNAPSTYGLEAAISNRTTLSINSSYCSSGSGVVTWTPLVGDNRKVVIQFFDPSSMSGFETIPEMDLNPMAFAIESRSVQGYPVTSLLRVDTSGAPGVAPVLNAGEAAELQLLAQGTSTKYTPASATNGAQIPSYSADPASPPAGSIWYNSTTGELHFRTGGGTQTVGTGSGGGTITNISVGNGLTGGGSSGSVSVSLPSGSSGQLLRYNGSNWAGYAVGLADLLNSSLASPVASAVCTAGQTMYYDTTSKDLKCQSIGLANADIAGTLGVAHGGTGLSSGTVGAIPYFSSTSALSALAAGSSGQVLTVDGTGVPAWQNLPAASFSGSGTATHLARFTGASAVGNSILVDDGTNVGIGTTTPIAKLEVAGSLRLSDGGESCSAGANVGMMKYSSGNLYFCNASGWQTLGVSGAGLTTLNGLTGSSQTFAVGSAGTTPAWSSSGSVHTLNLPAASATNSGILSSSDWSAFNGKLGTSTNFAGDVTGTYNANVVTKIQGVAVGTTAPTTGQVMKYGASTWAAANLGFGDLKTTGGAATLASAVCNAGQTMYYDTTTGDLKCQSIALGNASISGVLPIASGGTGAATTSQNFVFAGPTSGSGAPSFRALTAADISGLSTYWTSATGGINYAGGNVGLATTAPKAMFEVNGSTVAAPNAIARINATAGDPYNGPYSLVLGDDSQDSANYRGLRLGLTNQGHGFIYSSVAGSVKNLFLNPYGANVGIGTTVPAHRLDVVGGNIGLSASGYVNFGANDGSSGYGIRDNGGTIEVKSNAGSWTPIATGGLGGSGSTNYVPKFSASTTLGSSLIYDDGTNVGIGTTATSAGLHVKRALYNNATHPFNFNLEDSAAMAAGVGGGFVFSGNDGGSGDRWFAGVHGGKENGVSGDYAGFIGFHTRTNGASLIAERLRINSNGNVGIGTTVPGARLEVASGTANTSGLKFSNFNSSSPTGTGQAIGVDASGNLITVANGAASQWTNITGGISYSAGNVGIGTSTPGMPLVVQGVDNYGIMEVVGNGTNYQSTLGLRSQNVAAGSTGAWEIGAAGGSSGNFFVYTAGVGQVINATTTGNVGIGTTAPGAKLEIKSATAGTSGLKFSNLTSATATSSGQAIGVDASGNVVTVATGGASQWTNVTGGINYAGGLNVGIGTTAPADRIHLETTGQDQGLLITGSGSNYAQLKRADSGGAQLMLFQNGTATFNFDSRAGVNSYIMGNNFGLNTMSPGSILGVKGGASIGSYSDTAAPSNGLIVSGNVGIGSSAPTAKLEVKSGTANVSGVKLTNLTSASGTSSGQPIGVDASGNIVTVAAATSSQWTNVTGGINYASGFVGIGTSAPQAAMDVNGEFRVIGSANPASGAGIEMQYYSSAGSIFAYDRGASAYKPLTVTGSTLNLYGGNSTGITVSSLGNVGIGTTSPRNNLDVIGAVQAVGGYYMNTYYASSSWNQLTAGYGSVIYTDNSNGGIQFATSGSSATAGSTISVPVVMTIAKSGNVGIGQGTPTQKLEVNGNVLAAAYLYSSDIRLKTDITPLDNALQRILALHGVNYYWKQPLSPEADRRQLGVIAQDVEKQFPEAVTTGKDGIKRVNYPTLVAPLIEAIRELANQLTGHDARLEKLEQQNRELAAKNQALEQRLQRIERALDKRTPASGR